jgi:membrane fusion protein (multidrug efflux system)
MKVKHCIVMVLAVSLAGMALTYWYATTRSSAMNSTATVKTQPAVPPLITTARPTIRTFEVNVPWIGTVESQASVELTALIAARVEAIEAEDQTWIKKGGLIARLGGPQIDGQHARLAAEVETLEYQLELARKIVERLDKSLEAQLATKDQVAEAQDSQVKLKTQLHEARLNLDVFEKQVNIIAPMTGTFTNRCVSVGQDVNAGQVIGEIIDADHLRIVASIFPPQDVELQGKDATIRLDEEKTLTGLVQRVLPQAGGTGAVIVWIEGPQIDKQLRPSQTIGGSMVVKVRPEALAVPESAIVYDSEERPCVFILKDGAYEPHNIRLGVIQDGWVEILSGLEHNQSVVTQGAYELFYRQFNEQYKAED